MNVVNHGWQSESSDWTESGCFVFVGLVAMVAVVIGEDARLCHLP